MKKPLVVLSGGQDSTTCLYWAKAQPGVEEIHCLTFDYGQRHGEELRSASKVGQMAKVASHELIELPDGILIGDSPLVNSEFEVDEYDSEDELPGGIEKTFVPARNIMFLSIAANRASVLGCDSIIIGVSQEDFGGYPDCRGDFISAMSEAISQGLPEPVLIVTPLINKTKKETVELAVELNNGVIEALAMSHSCYQGEWPPCGRCHACLLRAKGFEEAGIPDPLIVYAHNYLEAGDIDFAS